MLVTAASSNVGVSASVADHDCSAEPKSWPTSRARHLPQRGERFLGPACEGPRPAGPDRRPRSRSDDLSQRVRPGEPEPGSATARTIGGDAIGDETRQSTVFT